MENELSIRKITWLYISWYENGQTEKSGDYKNGIKDGVWNYWNEDGKRSI